MRAAAAAVISFALGCAPSPPAAAPRPAPPAPAPAPPAPVTCAEAGVLLRGDVDDHEAAGPAKQAVIAKACERGGWSAAVLHCVGSQPRPGNCLQQLTAPQLEAYAQLLGSWNDDYPDEVLLAEDSGWEQPPLPRVWTCRDGVGEPAHYAPAPAAPGELAPFATALRLSAIRTQCETGWAQPVLACLSTGEVAPCRDLLEPAQQQALTGALAAADAVLARMLAASARPAAIDCRKVVAAHYGDPAWRGKLADQPARQRAKLIADSRAAMTRACGDDGWTASHRACVVVGGGAPCFTAAGQPARRWGFPALIAPAATGVPDCDLLLVDVQRAARCDAARSAIGDDQIEVIRQMIAPAGGRSPEQRKKLSDLCRRTSEAVLHVIAAGGCP